MQSSNLPNAATVIRLRCNNPDCGYSIAVNGAANGNTPFFYVVDSAGIFHVVTGTSSVVDGKWHHLVGTEDASGLRLYVDGVPVGSLSYTGSVAYGTVTGFAIGRDADDPNYYFKGSIGEVAVYGSALSSAQVANHQAAAVRAAPVPPTGGGSCPHRQPCAGGHGERDDDTDRQHDDARARHPHGGSRHQRGQERG
jgi:hypothetical protein